uniref:Uncharacterized protein n=1 Tax=Molossus molossus TaxID=27622 RepID=A0A7J8I9M3_MOLMO|nr:hypothetical protein HJG59_010659 [Molossus molossus]
MGRCGLAALFVVTCHIATASKSTMYVIAEQSTWGLRLKAQSDPMDLLHPLVAARWNNSPLANVTSFRHPGTNPTTHFHLQKFRGVDETLALPSRWVAVTLTQQHVGSLERDGCSVMGDPGQSCMSGTLNLVLCLMKTLNLDPLTRVLWGTECEDACGWL